MYLLLALLLLVLFLLLAFLYFWIIAVFFGAPFVPVHRSQVAVMMDLAGVGPGDTVVDLGSGDGRLVIAAAARGAEAVGYELNPFLVWWSRWRINRNRVEKRARIILGDYWNKDFSSVTVVTLFLITGKMHKMEEMLLRQLPHGARVVSYGFQFPTWPVKEKRGGVFLYVR